MGLGPVSFQPAVNTVIREMLWGEALAGHLACSLTNPWFTPIQWVFALGVSASKLEEGWNVWLLAGDTERRAQKLAAQ